jgi:DNA modification methylase
MAGIIFQGDNVEVLRHEVPDNSVQLTVTSPPYDDLRQYDGFTWDFESVARELYRVTKAGGVVVWVVADATVNGSETGTSFRQALYFKECGFDLYDTMIWAKQSPPTPTEGRYYAVFEYMFVFSKGKPNALNFLCDHKNKTAGWTGKQETRSSAEGRGYTGKTRTVSEFSRRWNIWQTSTEWHRKQAGHPASYPEALARDHILSWSNPGDTVLDPFLGSGTTGKMAIQLGRRFIGCDISSEYVAIAACRIAEAERILAEVLS